ncbi:MAG: glycerate dehydrogenase, partial [Gammaproteobacteria bacterium]
MKAVFLDYATVGSAELDISPLLKVLPVLKVFDNTAADEVIERIAGVEVIFANKVRLTREILDQSDAVR